MQDHGLHIIIQLLQVTHAEPRGGQVLHALLLIWNMGLAIRQGPPCEVDQSLLQDAIQLQVG